MAFGRRKILWGEKFHPCPGEVAPARRRTEGRARPLARRRGLALMAATLDLYFWRRSQEYVVRLGATFVDID